MLDDNRVAVTFTDLKSYPVSAPFHPPEYYPEYTGEHTDSQNKVYAEVRNTLFRLDLDKKNFNTPHWNPFKDIIHPGMTVFIKPNTVRHAHVQGKEVFSVIVHGSILRPVLDYVSIALKNEGKIIVGDSQVVFGQFDKAIEVSKIRELLTWYGDQTKIQMECFDLRMNRGVRTWMYGKWGRIKIEADPRGYRFVDLADKSYFRDIDPKRLRIAIASHKNMYKHHSNGRHEYMFPQSFLDSDAIISIPKLKTHRRTAITVALKNFMGLPSWKDSLPHFITGSVEEGGDQYIHRSWRKRVCTRLHDEIQSNPFIPIKFMCAVIKKALWNTHWIFPFKDNIYEAMWHGNDTLWRTLLDIHHIAFYADKEGKICDNPKRNFFCLTDGIIAGEKNGPVSPDPVTPGVLLAGFNPVALDAAAASLMGFDIDKIPLIKKGLLNNQPPNQLFFGKSSDIDIIHNDSTYSFNDFQKLINLHFEPHPNWNNYVERIVS